MNRRVLIGLIILAVLALLVVAALLFIQSQDQPQQQTQDGDPTQVQDGTPSPDGGTSEEDLPPTPTPALVQVVVSLQTVQRGFQMTEDIVDDILVYDMRRADEVPSNVLTDIDDAIGLFARTDIFQGETITVDTLVGDPTLVGIQEFGPSSLIPQGFLGMSIPLRDEIAAVAFAVDEGDYVDVLISFDIYRIDEQFQTYLENQAVFFVEGSIATQSTSSTDQGNGDAEEGDEDDEETVNNTLFFVESFGRIEELPNGDIVVVGPSSEQLPFHVGIVLQNARVVQVGQYQVPASILDQIPTPTPAVQEGAETPTPGPVAPPTPTPEPPSVIVIALAPQQQLLLKHAMEVNADIDFALRSTNDNQLFNVEKVDLSLLLELFDIEVPPNFNFTLEDPDGDSGSGNGGNGSAPTATPTSNEDEFGDG